MFNLITFNENQGILTVIFDFNSVLSWQINFDSIRLV